jgi:hypothetical protein
VIGDRRTAATCVIKRPEDFVRYRIPPPSAGTGTRHYPGRVDSSDFVVNSYRSAGKVEIRSAISPISLQGGRPRLADLKAMLGQAIGEGSDFLMTHDVEVTLTRFDSEHSRYQTHTAADLDNVIKPLLDAATEPDGVMIDDKQVQSIRASWMTPGLWGEGFDLTIASLNPEDTIQREGTAFVEFAPDTCHVLPGGRRRGPLSLKAFGRT